MYYTIRPSCISLSPRNLAGTGLRKIAWKWGGDKYWYLRLSRYVFYVSYLGWRRKSVDKNCDDEIRCCVEEGPTRWISTDICCSLHQAEAALAYITPHLLPSLMFRMLLSSSLYGTPFARRLCSWRWISRTSCYLLTFWVSKRPRYSIWAPSKTPQGLTTVLGLFF